MKYKYREVRDCISEISMGPFGSNIKVDSFVKSGVPVLNGSNLTGYKLREESFNYVTEDKARSLNKAIASRGDVVITHRGTLGQIVYIPKNSKYPHYVISQSQFRLRCNKNIILPEFLVYYFHSWEGQSKLLSNKSQVGVPALARPSSTFQDIEIPVPPLDEQQKIVKILDSLNDMIDHNTAINHHLEQIAQAIYKEWFIDNYEVRKWEERKLGDICEFSYGKGLKEDDRQPGPIGVYGSNGLIGWHDELLVRGPGIVVGRKGNPGTVTWAATDFYPIDTAFYVTKTNNDISLYWLFYTLKSLDLPNLSGDSAVPGLNRNIAYMSNVFCPPVELMHEFDELVKPTFETIHANTDESRTLAGLRDTLLPRLMSGEITVADVGAK
jgi:type I restriction enzyme S subunit